MDPGQWMLLEFLSKFVLLVSSMWLTGLRLVKLEFGVQVSTFLSVILWGIAVLTSITSFALTAGILMNSLSGMLDWAILSIVWDTPVGTALGLRGVGLALILISFFGSTRIIDWIGGAGAVAFLCSFAVSGHVASLEGGWLIEPLVLHLVIAASWIGVLHPLHRLSVRDPLTAAQLGERFGKVAIFCVPLMIAAGALMAWHLLESVRAIVSTTYGLFLLTKIAGVTALLIGAGLNKLRFVPALVDGDKTAGEKLAKTIELEGAAVVFVLALTAALTSFGGP